MRHTTQTKVESFQGILLWMNDLMQFHSSNYEINDSTGSLIAIIVRSHFEKPGVNFLSDPSFSIQLGVSSYKKGHLIQPHVHLQREIKLNRIQEVVHVDSGRTKVTLYDLNRQKLDVVELGAGDTIFFVDGGHGFEFMEDTKFIEVKQGPYANKEKDKCLIK